MTSSVVRIGWPGWMAKDLLLFAVLGLSFIGTPWSITSIPNDGTLQIDGQADSLEAAQSDQPAQSDKDREVTRKIRRAIVTDKSLSTYAHNITITTRDGMVTLKGEVRSAEEKSSINGTAKKIVGPDKIKDELTVRTRD